MTTTDTTPSDETICRAVGWEYDDCHGWYDPKKRTEDDSAYLNFTGFDSLAADLLAVIAACDATGLGRTKGTTQCLSWEDGTCVVWFSLDKHTLIYGENKPTEAAAKHAALCELVQQYPDGGWRK